MTATPFANIDIITAPLELCDLATRYVDYDGGRHLASVIQGLPRETRDRIDKWIVMVRHPVALRAGTQESRIVAVARDLRAAIDQAPAPTDPYAEARAIRERAMAVEDELAKSERDRIAALPAVRPTPLQTKRPPKGWAEGVVVIALQENRTLEVPAYVPETDGHFAVHHPPSSKRSDGSYETPGRVWTVTHRQTGMSAGTAIKSLAVAVDFTRTLDLVGQAWDGEKVTDTLRDTLRATASIKQTLELYTAGHAGVKETRSAFAAHRLLEQ